MSRILEPFLRRNREFAASEADRPLTAVPTGRLIVVTCVDPRVDPARILGTELGEVTVIRVAGGRVTPDVAFQLAFVTALTESVLDGDPPEFQVAVIHHTQCGTHVLTDPDFRRRLAERTGKDDAAIADIAVGDPFESVMLDVEIVRRMPALPTWVTVSGHVYDVDTGLLTAADT